MHAYTESDIAQLQFGEGQVLYGDGALVVLKSLLQSGISYFGGYPGAPTANLIDAVADAYEPVLKPMGVYVESSANEMSAGAMMTASAFAEIRGAVTWKVLGNSVASDVLDHIAAIGVKDGAMIIVGEDYGVASTSVAMRSLPWAMKSGMPVIDPRGDLQILSDMVMQGMEMSKISGLPVVFLLRPQLSHTHGFIRTKGNRRAVFNVKDKIARVAKDPSKTPLPPNTQQHERSKYQERLPKAEKFLLEHRLNERFGSPKAKIGLITHGFTCNTVMRILSAFGLANEDGWVDERLDILQLNVIFPLSERQVLEFFEGKEIVLLVEEGKPNLLEQSIRSILHRSRVPVAFHGQDIVPDVGELTPDRLLPALAQFLERALPELGETVQRETALRLQRKEMAEKMLEPVTPRVPTFCVGCPERPVFSQMKIMEELSGEVDFHAGDVGCYGMAGLAPFWMADSNIGMGAGLAAAAALSEMTDQKVVSVIGDGTLWHSGLNSSVVNALYNNQNATYVVLDNGWTAMTGHHENPTTGQTLTGEKTRVRMKIEEALRGLGIRKVEKENPYDYRKFTKKLKRLREDPEGGLRVLISEAECQLERQRRIRPKRQKDIAAGKRVVVERLGVDDEVCVGDHACIRFNGCPSLTLGESPNRLRESKIATIDHQCVGCGVCGEVAQAAWLCPSFYKVSVVINTPWYERIVEKISGMFVRAKAG
ncbi:indolepyruvate ferredoxin oxidoreductase subunit alpha [Kyrpidia tusciae]|uniref:Indolepyruvate ferredoxin oxidoreductase n=1 Tax=Kyrpidia tusciae (strain DSM 2912 / NBRC 15312 / T2) TaxID=562970 RepID=D5WSJ7_KYRT2|nr:indolepyruvate ferredoxin oxidoreductase subunit alpha [Kyrpidia tusciae]ADG07016.1 Indolepyruvate ferredoxin oxidoreductase [Kyrpidia tusciae DSM 2912]